MKKIHINRQIGLWMDHAEAKLIDPTQSPSAIRVLHSGIESRVRIPGESPDGTRLGGYRSTNNEDKKHNRNHNETQSYYKELAEVLEPYDEILIFGPTDAQKEFHNFIVKDKKFSGKRILSRTTDYLTDNQLSEFVRENMV